uniref:Uncharacterized protein n=1 Tax=Caenorhabditis japonica TaxID=281687 RepID=A0A8R1E7D6_CAEJA
MHLAHASTKIFPHIPLQIRVFNAFDDSQPRLLATSSSSGQVLLDTLIPLGEKIHKVSDFFVYLKTEERTIGFNTLSARDTALLISQSSNTSAFNMFQHAFTASVSRIATFEADQIVACTEPPETSNVSLTPLNMAFNYKGCPVTIDLVSNVVDALFLCALYLLLVLLIFHG